MLVLSTMLYLQVYWSFGGHIRGLSSSDGNPNLNPNQPPNVFCVTSQYRVYLNLQSAFKSVIALTAIGQGFAILCYLIYVFIYPK